MSVRLSALFDCGDNAHAVALSSILWFILWHIYGLLFDLVCSERVCKVWTGVITEKSIDGNGN